MCCVSCTSEEEPILPVEDPSPTVAEEVEGLMTEFTRALTADSLSGSTDVEIYAYFITHVLPRYGIAPILNDYRYTIDRIGNVVHMEVGGFTGCYSALTNGYSWATTYSDSLQFIFRGPRKELCEYSLSAEDVGEAEPLETVILGDSVSVTMPSKLTFISKVDSVERFRIVMSDIEIYSSTLNYQHTFIKNGETLLSGFIESGISLSELAMPNKVMAQLKVKDRLLFELNMPNNMMLVMGYLTGLYQNDVEKVQMVCDQMNAMATCTFYLDGIAQGSMYFEPIYENGTPIADLVVKYTSDGTSYAYFHGIITKIYSIVNRYSALTSVYEWLKELYDIYLKR